jgi:putative oxidoreductase
MQALQAVASLVGRILLVVIFLVSGYGKLMDPAGTKQFMANMGHLPYVDVLFICTVIVELGGGLMVLVGWKARLAALVLCLFLIPVTLTFHTNFADRMQQLHFLTNLSIMGGLLMVVVYGAGAISIDGRCCRLTTEQAQQARPPV